ncbi:hypothetical protein [Xanthomonas retroflexus]|uniref:hypothetical protein n=1 Tax=Stenotrophomonas indicatrix TaxID=2045451 RepID=UPI000B449EBF
MPEIKLNREDSMQLLNDGRDDQPNARVVAAAAVLFFEIAEAADDVDGNTRQIVHKLLRMSASALDEAAEAAANG